MAKPRRFVREDGEESVMTSVRLSMTERAFLEAEGGIAPTIHRLIKEAMWEKELETKRAAGEETRGIRKRATSTAAGTSSRSKAASSGAGSAESPLLAAAKAAKGKR